MPGGRHGGRRTRQRHTRRRPDRASGPAPTPRARRDLSSPLTNSARIDSVARGWWRWVSDGSGPAAGSSVGDVGGVVSDATLAGPRLLRPAASRACHRRVRRLRRGALRTVLRRAPGAVVRVRQCALIDAAVLVAHREGRVEQAEPVLAHQPDRHEVADEACAGVGWLSRPAGRGGIIRGGKPRRAPSRGCGRHLTMEMPA